MLRFLIRPRGAGWLALLLWVLLPAAADAAGRPNVVFIMTDQQFAEAMSCRMGNRHLIDNMGKAGRGAVAYLGPKDSGAQIMEDFFGRISHPALTDLQIDWGGLYVSEVFPSAVPDLFVGRPVILTGRFAENQDTTVRVRGKVGSQPMQVPIPADLTGACPAFGHE